MHTSHTKGTLYTLVFQAQNCIDSCHSTPKILKISGGISPSPPVLSNYTILYLFQATKKHRLLQIYNFIVTRPTLKQYLLLKTCQLNTIIANFKPGDSYLYDAHGFFLYPRKNMFWRASPEGEQIQIHCLRF